MIRNAWAIIPAKRLDCAKERLSLVLSKEERAALAQVMLKDVLRAVSGTPGLDGIAVVTADPSVAEIAQAFAAQVVAENGNDGLNPALQRAFQHVQEHGGHSAIVVPSDLPQVSPADIGRVLARVDAHTLLLVPATEDGGTNGLACSTPARMTLCFGSNSLRRHIWAAREAGLKPRIVMNAALGRDLDRPDDLAAFIALNTRTETHELLSRMRYAFALGSRVDKPSGEVKRIDAAGQ